MSNLSNPSGDEHDLAWRAFCYISGELSAEQEAEFEALLAVDQQAREETARAVELAQAIASASPATVERRPAPWAARVAWMLVGTAACLLAVVSLNFWSHGPGDDSASWPGAPADAASRQLAAAWAGSSLSDAQAAGDEEGPYNLLLIGPDAGDSGSFDSNSVDADHDSGGTETGVRLKVADSVITVPEWLLAAVSAQPAADHPAAGPDGPSEN